MPRVRRGRVRPGRGGGRKGVEGGRGVKDAYTPKPNVHRRKSASTAGCRLPHPLQQRHRKAGTKRAGVLGDGSPATPGWRLQGPTQDPGHCETCIHRDTCSCSRTSSLCFSIKSFPHPPPHLPPPMGDELVWNVGKMTTVAKSHGDPLDEKALARKTLHRAALDWRSARKRREGAGRHGASAGRWVPCSLRAIRGAPPAPSPEADESREGWPARDHPGRAAAEQRHRGRHERAGSRLCLRSLDG